MRKSAHNINSVTVFLTYIVIIYTLMTVVFWEVKVFLFFVDDEDDDSAFGTGPKLQRAISINLRSLITAADSPPPSPPDSQQHTPHNTPHTSPVSSLTKLSPVINSAISTTTPAAATAAAVTSTTGISKTSLPLVDYPDEDSDEDFSEADGTSPAKRARVNSTWKLPRATKHHHQWWSHVYRSRQ